MLNDLLHEEQVEIHAEDDVDEVSVDKVWSGLIATPFYLWLTQNGKKYQFDIENANNIIIVLQ